MQQYLVVPVLVVRMTCQGKKGPKLFLFSSAVPGSQRVEQIVVRTFYKDAVELFSLLYNISKF